MADEEKILFNKLASDFKFDEMTKGVNFNEMRTKVVAELKTYIGPSKIKQVLLNIFRFHGFVNLGNERSLRLLTEENVILIRKFMESTERIVWNGTPKPLVENGKSTYPWSRLISLFPNLYVEACTSLKDKCRWLSSLQDGKESVLKVDNISNLQYFYPPLFDLVSKNTRRRDWFELLAKDRPSRMRLFEAQILRDKSPINYSII